MVGELATCLNSDGNSAGTVVDVKVTGLNGKSDEETILPYDPGGPETCSNGPPLCNGGSCQTSYDLVVFEDAGYTADSGAEAYMSFVQATHAAFPGLPVGSQISSEMLLPAGIVDAGFGTYARVLTELFVTDAGQYSITSQEQGLAADAGADTQGIQVAMNAGIPIGFQMVLSVVGYSGPCEMSQGLQRDGGCLCPDVCVLLAAIDNGVGHGARWLEIYEQDLLAYPDAGQYAHDLMLDAGYW